MTGRVVLIPAWECTAESSLQFLTQWLVCSHWKQYSVSLHHFSSLSETQTACLVCVLITCIADAGFQFIWFASWVSELAMVLVQKLLSLCFCLWRSFKLTLTECNTEQHTLYDAGSDVVTRALLSFIDNLLMRKILFIWSVHRRPSAFSNIQSNLVE